jgi:hypothetical protein
VATEVYIPQHSTGTPTKFFPHPLRYIDHKEQARIRKQASGHDPTVALQPGQRFGMDFGFICASTLDLSRQKSTNGRVVESYDGFVAYLIIIDEASRYVWIFLRKSKEPPTDLVSHFLQMYGRSSGGVIRCDQGGKLARSDAFRSIMMEKHLYVVEPTGADSPSQNGFTEKWNDTLAVTTCVLLYGASLPPKYWSAALVHAAYIHNCRVHARLKTTPFERWYGSQPNLRHLRIFGSRVCVKRTGHRRAKLDKHDFTGIFIGYTATDSNIRYIDLDSGVVKTSHHAVFDECWYHQNKRPPAAQLLYDLGMQVVATAPPPPSSSPSDMSHGTGFLDDTAANTPIDPNSDDIHTDNIHTQDDESTQPRILSIQHLSDPSTADHYGITHRDVEQVYFSQHCFGNTFKETFSYHGSPTLVHPTAGLVLDSINGRVLIRSIDKGTPCAKIPRWRTRLRNTWLLQINDTPVSSIEATVTAFATLPSLPRGECTLLVSSSDLRDGLTNEGIPQISLDQLNPRHFFTHSLPPTSSTSQLCHNIAKSWDGGVLQYITRACRLTCGVLMKQDDWDEWQQAKFLQLDQYELQNMFGQPVVVSDISAVFNLIWTYAVKEVDGRKKARCTCDGSTRGGQVRILDLPRLIWKLTGFPLYMTNAENTGHMVWKSRGHFYNFFYFL